MVGPKQHHSGVLPRVLLLLILAPTGRSYSWPTFNSSQTLGRVKQLEIELSEVKNPNSTKLTADPPIPPVVPTGDAHQPASSPAATKALVQTQPESKAPILQVPVEDNNLQENPPPPVSSPAPTRANPLVQTQPKSKDIKLKKKGTRGKLVLSQVRRKGRPVARPGVPEQGRFTRLRVTINSKRLREVDLKKDPKHNLPPALLKCQGPACPYGLEVYELRNVYLNQEGEAFNKTHWFRRSGCTNAPTATYMAGRVRVLHVNNSINLVYRPKLSFFHALIEWMPVFVLLAPLLRMHADMKTLGSPEQWEVYERLAAPLLGVPLSAIPHVSMPGYSRNTQDSRLYFAERVLYPVYQHCGSPDRRLWTDLRESLLQEEGVPLFTGAWERRHPPRRLMGSKGFDLPKGGVANNLGADWVVVLFKRSLHRRSIVQVNQIEGLLRREFGTERVKVFDGSTSILEARALFRRALLAVAAHGAGLSNMIFMPMNSTVLEVRPRSYNNGCYSNLANACMINYHSVFGEGGFSTQIDVDVNVFAKHLKGVKKKLPVVK